MDGAAVDGAVVVSTCESAVVGACDGTAMVGTENVGASVDGE